MRNACLILFNYILNNPRPFVIIPDAGTNDKIWVNKINKNNNYSYSIIEHSFELSSDIGVSPSIIRRRQVTIKSGIGSRSKKNRIAIPP